MSKITDAQFADFPNRSGLTTFNFAELQAALGLASQVGKGALIRDSGITLSSSNSGGDGTQVPFTAPNLVIAYDDLAFFDDALDGFVIPDVTPAIQRVQCWMQCGWESGSTGDGTRQLRILHNGDSYDDNTLNGIGMGGQLISGGFGINSDTPLHCITAPVDVAVGDVFTFFGKQNIGANLSLTDVAAAIVVVR